MDVAGAAPGKAMAQKLALLVCFALGWILVRQVAAPPVGSEAHTCPDRASAAERVESRPQAPGSERPEDELEELWSASAPVTGEPERERVRQALDQRLLHFTLFEEHYARRPATGRTDELLALTSDLGVRETAFMLLELERGRVRRAPSAERARVAQGSQDLELQLVPVFGSDPETVYLFRIELAREPRLFLDRREIGRLGMEITAELPVAAAPDRGGSSPSAAGTGLRHLDPETSAEGNPR